MTNFSRPYLGLALRHPDVLQGTVQRDHITGHQVELVDLELLLLLLLLVGGDGDGLAHLPRHPLVLGHHLSLAPAAQLVAGIAQPSLLVLITVLPI